MNKYADYIKSNLDKRTLNEQLAEECCELAQAVLKKIRADGQNNNITPKTPAEALEDVIEELNDVLLVLSLIVNEDFLKTMVNNIDKYPKWKRWAYRLGYSKGEME